MKKNFSALAIILLGLTTIISNTTPHTKMLAPDNQIKTNLNQINNADIIEKTILASENRSLQHSFLTPTSYFLEKDKEYLIKINKRVSINDLLYITIGQWGEYAGLNEGKSIGFQTQQIIGETLNITPKISGMLYLKDYRFTKEIKILNISKNNPIKVPTFFINKTNQAIFFNEIKTTNSFFIEIISEHVFGTFQTKMFIDKIINSPKVNINNTILAWDKIWKYSNETYGLNEKYLGSAKKQQQFIHITNPDTGPGYASATNYQITFQNKTNAGSNLFINNITNQWGLWHEIGHTYQTPNYKWKNLTEVTVNISSLRVQKEIAKSNNLDNKNNIKKVKAYFNYKDKNFNEESDLFVKLTMFWQLQMAFGNNFYPTLAQFYRTNTNRILDMQQDFVKIVAKVAERNLIPFFNQWGIKMTDTTKNSLIKLPTLKNNIWQNIINENHQPIIEREIPKYQVSTLKNEITPKKVINFGTKITANNLTTFFDVAKNNNILAHETTFNWISYFVQDKKYYVPTKIVVQDQNALANSYMYFVPTSFANTLQFIGYAYLQRGIVGLDQENKKFVFTGSGIGLDASQNKQKEYYRITIKKADGTIIKQIIFKAGDNFTSMIIAHDLLNISYQEGDTIETENLFANKTRFFSIEGNTWKTNNKKSSKYLILNDVLVPTTI